MSSESGTATRGSSASDYALGSSDRERQRLMQQGALLHEFTASAFRAAGIGPGMRVLDLGCGVGDVSLAAAELVGPTGTVVGLDRDPANVAWAAKRFASAGYTNVHPQTCEFSAFSTEQPFDALVGRFILMYLPDPAATIRQMLSHLRSGASVAFVEIDAATPARREPEFPLIRECERWFVEVLRRSGARVDMGMHLYHAYRDAGLPKPGTSVFHLSGCGVNREIIDFFVEGIRSILPKIEQFGIATREQVQIDTLADRLEAAASAADAQWVSSRYVAAWTRKP